MLTRIDKYVYVYIYAPSSDRFLHGTFGSFVLFAFISSISSDKQIHRERERYVFGHNKHTPFFDRFSPSSSARSLLLSPFNCSFGCCLCIELIPVPHSIFFHWDPLIFVVISFSDSGECEAFLLASSHLLLYSPHSFSFFYPNANLLHPRASLHVIL